LISSDFPSHFNKCRTWKIAISETPPAVLTVIWLSHHSVLRNKELLDIMYN